VADSHNNEDALRLEMFRYFICFNMFVLVDLFSHLATMSINHLFTFT